MKEEYLMIICTALIFLGIFLIIRELKRETITFVRDESGRIESIVRA